MDAFSFSGCKKALQTTLAEVCRALVRFSLVHQFGNLPARRRTGDQPTHAFAYCKSLKHVRLSTRMTRISNTAFSGCESLQYVEIPDSVTEIATQAFQDCTALEQLEIPASVQKISEAF